MKPISEREDLVLTALPAPSGKAQHLLCGPQVPHPLCGTPRTLTFWGPEPLPLRHDGTSNCPPSLISHTVFRPCRPELSFRVPRESLWGGEGTPSSGVSQEESGQDQNQPRPS